MTPASTAKPRAKKGQMRGGLGEKATRDLSAALNALLADVYALYFKTKNFHWHVSGPHFRDYHLLLDEQGDQIFAIGDPIAERVRKLGGTTLRSIGHVARLQRVLDNDAEYVAAAGHARGASRGQRASRTGCALSTDDTCRCSTATSPPRACSKSGSTKRKGVPGSCSRPRAAATFRDAEKARTTDRDGSLRPAGALGCAVGLRHHARGARRPAAAGRAVPGVRRRARA